MFISLRHSALLFLLFCASAVYSQNETAKWYFGNFAGIDFMTTPPTVLTNGMVNTLEGSSGICDAAGNLLFYTDGVTVYNSVHSVMTNGTGLLGGTSPCQSSIIVPYPGQPNLYVIFTINGIGGTPGSNYSIVDMSLSGGLGAVTVKNSLLYNGSCSEQITATRHCNNKDIWVVTHERNSNAFRAYLLNSLGVNSVAVISSVGTTQDILGCMKISPNGKKLGCTNPSFSSIPPVVELFDFDNSTGVLSNPVVVSTGFNAYGCEFSADGTKFYCGAFGTMGGSGLRQFNLCAGSGTAIAASVFSIAATSVWSLQRAPDGKIYVAKGASSVSSTLGVIHNPDVAGAGCNYVDNGFSISPKGTFRGLPNFMSMHKILTPPFTFTVSNSAGCQTASFTPQTSNTSSSSCASIGDFLTGLSWNFGDPSSGNANVSTQNNPVHTYYTAGSYTTTLILYYSCWSDTLHQVVTIGGAPTLNVAGNFTVCEGETHTYTVTGANSYSWNTGAVSPTLSIGPAAFSTTYQVVGIATSGCSSNKTFTVMVNKTPTLSFSGALSVCPGEKRVYTASGASSYSWSTGSTTPSITVITSNSFMYTVVGTGTNGCTSQRTLAVTVNKCTGISEAGAVPGTVRFYPNPVNDVLHLENSEPAVILLFNLEGKLVLKKEYEPGHQQLDLSLLQNGAYSIQTITDEESRSRKLVKLSD